MLAPSSQRQTLSAPGLHLHTALPSSVKTYTQKMLYHEELNHFPLKTSLVPGNPYCPTKSCQTKHIDFFTPGKVFFDPEPKLLV
jgi:hypothetical protein